MFITIKSGNQQTLATKKGDKLSIWNASIDADLELFSAPNGLLNLTLLPRSGVVLPVDGPMTVQAPKGDIEIEYSIDKAGTEGMNKYLDGMSFYIDPGHGGSDPGAVNTSLDYQEKVAALDIANLLRASLFNFGAQCYMSRLDNATYPSINYRAEEANKREVTAFISIHLNSSDNGTANGIETLCYSNKGVSGKLATAVQEQLIKETGAKNRGVKERPDLGVLRLTKMPAILVETGFISHEDEARKLFSPEWQSRIAGAIAEGVLSTFGKV